MLTKKLKSIIYAVRNKILTHSKAAQLNVLKKKVKGTL